MTGRTAARSGTKSVGMTGRRRHQEVAGLPVVHEMHEAVDRRGLGLVVGNIGRFESVGGRTAFAHPHRKDRLRRHALVALALGDRDDGFCRVERRRERRRHVHHQNRIVGVVLEQAFERDGVAVSARITGDVGRIGARPDRRQRGIKLLHRVGRDGGKLAAQIDQTIDRQHADAAAIGQNGKTRAGKLDKRASVSAAANNSSRSNTRSKPARRNAAS